jgi:hypothetical protein
MSKGTILRPREPPLPDPHAQPDTTSHPLLCHLSKYLTKFHLRLFQQLGIPGDKVQPCVEEGLSKIWHCACPLGMPKA